MHTRLTWVREPAGRRSCREHPRAIQSGDVWPHSSGVWALLPRHSVVHGTRRRWRCRVRMRCPSHRIRVCRIEGRQRIAPRHLASGRRELLVAVAYKRAYWTCTDHLNLPAVRAAHRRWLARDIHSDVVRVGASAGRASAVWLRTTGGVLRFGGLYRQRGRYAHPGLTRTPLIGILKLEFFAIAVLFRSCFFAARRPHVRFASAASTHGRRVFRAAAVVLIGGRSRPALTLRERFCCADHRREWKPSEALGHRRCSIDQRRACRCWHSGRVLQSLDLEDRHGDVVSPLPRMRYNADKRRKKTSRNLPAEVPAAVLFVRARSPSAAAVPCPSCTVCRAASKLSGQTPLCFCCAAAAFLALAAATLAVTSAVCGVRVWVRKLSGRQSEEQYFRGKRRLNQMCRVSVNFAARSRSREINLRSLKTGQERRFACWRRSSLTLPWPRSWSGALPPLQVPLAEVRSFLQ